MPRPLDFTNDIVPLLSKQVQQRGLPRESHWAEWLQTVLFGFDPMFDYAALVHEGRGRRISARLLQMIR
jgi:hypothetical protein